MSLPCQSCAARVSRATNRQFSYGRSACDCALRAARAKAAASHSAAGLVAVKAAAVKAEEGSEAAEKAAAGSEEAKEAAETAEAGRRTACACPRARSRPAHPGEHERRVRLDADADHRRHRHVILRRAQRRQREHEPGACEQRSVTAAQHGAHCVTPLTARLALGPRAASARTGARAPPRPRQRVARGTSPPYRPLKWARLSSSRHQRRDAAHCGD